MRQPHKTYVCGKCGQAGHNSRTCGKNTVGETPPTSRRPSLSGSTYSSPSPDASAQTNFGGMLTAVAEHTPSATHSNSQPPSPFVCVGTVAALKRLLHENGTCLVSLHNAWVPENTGMLYWPRKVKTNNVECEVEYLRTGEVKDEWVFPIPAASQFTVLDDNSWVLDNGSGAKSVYALFRSEAEARKYIRSHRRELLETGDELIKQKTEREEKRLRKQEEERRLRLEQWETRHAEQKKEYDKNPRQCNYLCGRTAPYGKGYCEECEKKDDEENARRKERTLQRERDMAADVGKLKRTLDRMDPYSRRHVTIRFKDGTFVKKARVFVNDQNQAGYMVGNQHRKGRPFQPIDTIVTDVETGEVMFCGEGMIPEYAKKAVAEYGLTQEEAEDFVRLKGIPGSE